MTDDTRPQPGPTRWLTEAAVTALAWEGKSGSESPWRTWVHVLWDEDLYVSPEGFESNRIMFKDQLVNIGRTPVPDVRTLSQVAPDLVLGPHARGVVVLVRGRLCMEGILPALPTMLPATPSWPAPEAEPEPHVSPRSTSFPVVTAFAMDTSGNMMSVARVADPSQAATSGLFPSGLSLENMAFPFPASAGFQMSDPWENPGPWLSLILRGDSGVDPDKLPAGPQLPVLSRWLGTLCDVVDLYPGNVAAWRSALGDLDRLAGYDTWSKVQADQQTDRVLGEWVRLEDANRFDLGLFALAFLNSVPAPLTVRAYLASRLTPEQKEQVNAAAGAHPELLVWVASGDLL